MKLSNVANGNLYHTLKLVAPFLGRSSQKGLAQYHRIAHLILATEEDGELRLSARSERAGLALKKRLDALSIPQAALAGVKTKGAVWCRPSLHAEIAYRGWTAHGELRQASVKGLREEG
jgi:ATP-dependent DNA ligase